MFSNYPNISPANTMNGTLIGCNGSGSPTSNLFPSITSLFQSPIGTPRVTPTPQHFAAYLFNEEQFHSLIFPSSSSLSNGNSQNDAFLDAVLLSNTSNILSSQSLMNNNDLSTNLSPLPLFNNLISTSISNSLNNNNNSNTNSGNNNSQSSVNNSNSKSDSATTNLSNDSKSANILLPINN